MREVWVYDKDFGMMVPKRESRHHNRYHELSNPDIPTPMVMADCYHTNPVQSPVDGRPLDSRAALREHNKRNDVIDVGNDQAAIRPSKREYDMKDLERDLVDAYDKFDQNNPEALAAVERSKNMPDTDLSSARIL